MTEKDYYFALNCAMLMYDCTRTNIAVVQLIVGTKEREKEWRNFAGTVEPL